MKLCEDKASTCLLTVLGTMEVKQPMAQMGKA